MREDRAATAKLARAGDFRKPRTLSTYLDPSSPSYLAKNALTLFGALFGAVRRC